MAKLLDRKVRGEVDEVGEEEEKDEGREKGKEDGS